jgi:ATP-dependent Clp protease adaptor protein ClpS
MQQKMSSMNNVQLSEMSKKQSTTKRGQWQVILHNDDINTFEYVIGCLMDICSHNYLQAVQCANIVHNIKQCSVYVSNYDDCEMAFEELYSQGLNVTLEKYKQR